MDPQKIGKPLPIELLDLKPITPDELNIVGDFQRTVSMLLGYTGSALVPVKVDSDGVIAMNSSGLETVMNTVVTKLTAMATSLVTMTSHLSVIQTKIIVIEDVVDKVVNVVGTAIRTDEIP